MRLLHSLTALALLSVGTGAAAAAELSDRLAPLVARHYQSVADRRNALSAAIDPANRLELARLLAAGQPIDNADPLPKPDIAGANRLIDQVVAAGTPLQRQQALAIRAAMLLKSPLVADSAAGQALQHQLAAEGYLPALSAAVSAGQGLPAGMTEADAERALQQGVLDGDANATAALATLLASTDPARSKIVAAQALVYLAANALTSIAAQTELGRRYLVGEGVPQDSARALALLGAASATGANQPLSILHDAVSQHVAGIDSKTVKPIIEQALAAGSSKAAEFVVDDVMNRPVYGFSADDARYAVGLVARLGDRPSLVLAARAYASGFGGAPDIAHAIPYIEQLGKVDGLAPAAILDVAESLDALNLPMVLALKYVEPLYRRVAGPGTDGIEAEYRADRLLAAATEAHQLAIGPTHAAAILTALRAAGAAGHARSLILLGDLAYFGTWVPVNVRLAIDYYGQSMAIDANVTVRERLAKALLAVKNSPFDEQRYRQLVADLAKEGDPWGLYRKGVDLIADNTDVAGGEKLLLDLSAKAYDPAVKALVLHLAGVHDETRIDEAVNAFTTAWNLRKDARIGLDLAAFYTLAGRTDAARALYLDPVFDGNAMAALGLAKLYATAAPPEPDKALATAVAGLKLASADPATEISLVKVMLGLTLPEAQSAANTALLQLADDKNADAIALLMPAYIGRLATDPAALQAVDGWSQTLAAAGVEAPLLQLANRYLRGGTAKPLAARILDISTRALAALPPESYLGVLVAHAYYNGYGTVTDVPHANALIERGASAGNKDALAELGIQFFYGEGRARNPDTAVALLDSAAALGSNVARVQLGRLYSSASGPTVDMSGAYSSFRTAANNGSTAGMLEVGRLYLAGWGIGQDEATGVSWLEKSAGLGNTDAMYQLYFHYLAKGDAADLATAMTWLQRSADAGVNPARLRLAQHLLHDDPVGNYDKAIALLDQAFADGYNLARKFKRTVVPSGQLEPAAAPTPVPARVSEATP